MNAVREGVSCIAWLGLGLIACKLFRHPARGKIHNEVRSNDVEGCGNSKPEWSYGRRTVTERDGNYAGAKPSGPNQKDASRRPSPRLPPSRPPSFRWSLSPADRLKRRGSQKQCDDYSDNFWRSHRPNEKEISHGGASWQTRRSCIAMGPLASSIG